MVDHKVNSPLTQYEDSKNHHTHLPMLGEDHNDRVSQRAVDLHSIIANKSGLRTHDKLMTRDGI